MHLRAFIGDDERALKLADVRQRLDALHRLEGDLMHLIAECSQAPAGESCPTLDRLEHAEEHPGDDVPR